MKFLVWVEIPLDDQRKTAMTSIVVKEGDFIDTIKQAIKKENSHTFASVDAFEMELFESVEDIQQTKPPLDPTLEWKPYVTWGTAAQPLIAIVPVKRVESSQWSNSNGEC